MKSTAIILAGGRGSRMNSDIPKQYIQVLGRPLLSYTVEAFEKSDIDEIVLATGAGDEEYCREKIVKPGGFTKVSRIVHGGKERYDSVYQGLLACEETDIVLVHDGARCLVTPELINALLVEVYAHRACIAAVPVKDTIKLADADGCVRETPRRSDLWSVQTPQGFFYNDLLAANARMYEEMHRGAQLGITDDSMIMERFSAVPVHILEGDYTNIKVTTPEDLQLVEQLLRSRQKQTKK
jgi:2-C-methyl-D-erythritol 4-phosphate cytidylyltransferase